MLKHLLLHSFAMIFPHTSIITISALDWSRWDVSIWSLFFKSAFDTQCLISLLLSNKDKETGDNSDFRTSSSSLNPSYAGETQDLWVNYFCIEDFEFSSHDRFLTWFRGLDFILNWWMKSIWPACLELSSLLLSNLDAVVIIPLFIGNIFCIYVDKSFEISLKGINALLQTLSDASSIIFIIFSPPFCIFFMKFLWLWSCFSSHFVKIFQYLCSNGKATGPLLDYVWLQLTPTIHPGPFWYLINVVSMSRDNKSASWNDKLDLDV